VSSIGNKDNEDVGDELGSPTEPATPCICVGGQSVCQHRAVDQYSSAGSLAHEDDTNRGSGNSAEPIRDDSSQPSVSTEAPRPAQPLKAPPHASPRLSSQAQSVNAQQKQSHMAPGPSSPVLDKPRQFSAEPSLQPNAPSRRKRKRVETRKAREAREDSALLNSLERRRGGGLGHAFPPNRREWEIEDLEDVQLAKDGSIRCLAKWKPTMIDSTALVGKRVQKRLEELFKEKYGAEEWMKNRRTLRVSSQRRSKKRYERRS